MKGVLKNICHAALEKKLHTVKNFLADFDVVRTAEDGAVVVLDNQLGDFVGANAVAHKNYQHVRISLALHEAVVRAKVMAAPRQIFHCLCGDFRRLKCKTFGLAS